MEILKLYCPATGELLDTSDRWDEEMLEDDMIPLDGADLTGYTDLIQAALEREMDFDDGSDRGLMEYYGEEDSVDQKVHSMTVSVEELDGRLYGVATCEVEGTLTAEELDALKEYFSGQMSDGFGEGFEQREIKTEHGELYVHLWQFKDYYVLTGQEMTARREARMRAKVQFQAHKPKHNRGGDAR